MKKNMAIVHIGITNKMFALMSLSSEQIVEYVCMNNHITAFPFKICTKYLTNNSYWDTGLLC